MCNILPFMCHMFIILFCLFLWTFAVQMAPVENRPPEVIIFIIFIPAFRVFIYSWFFCVENLNVYGTSWKLSSAIAGISPGVIVGICMAIGVSVSLVSWYLVYIRRKKKKEALLSNQSELKSRLAGTLHFVQLHLHV